MTSQSPRIYIYKITFEEVLYYYYGVHKEKKFGEYYMGSPVTHKWVWDFYTPKKQILEFFDFTDEGWLEANLVEDRIIKPFYQTDKWCLNASCGGLLSIETCINGGKITGKKSKELGVGIHGRTKEQRVEDARKGGKKAKELGLGVHGMAKEQMSENGKKGGPIGGKIGGTRAYELGVGIYAITPEQKSQTSKKTAKEINSQKWMCLETGHISTPGSLTKYQRNRGIDTSKRKRIE